MSNLTDAADACLQWAEKNKAIFDIATALKSIGSIDQAIVERNHARAAAEMDCRAALANLAAAEASYADLIAKIQTEVQQARTEAAALLIDARQEADAIKAQARTEAAEIVAVAKRDAADAIAVADEPVSRAKKQLSDAIKALAAKQATLAAAHAEHDDIKSKVEAMKATAQSLLGFAAR